MYIHICVNIHISQAISQSIGLSIHRSLDFWTGPSSSAVRATPGGKAPSLRAAGGSGSLWRFT